MKQIYNPYLPLYEHIPDGEPHVFGDRIYIYGSHDVMDGKKYCEEDYVVWSAPVSDLKEWRREGVVYRREQDPSNSDGVKQLWAPDVTQGFDGRYYLYYCFNLHPEIGVAVSDAPEGPFEFYGHVRYPVHITEDQILKHYMPFDPAVFTDMDHRVYLYFGFAPVCENSMVVELEQDMLTMKGEPRALIPGGDHARGTDFEDHGFFEASSIRRWGDTYYFVYSSCKSHELCYATSRYPDRDFIYGGTIVSNGDIGMDGRIQACNVLGNNHGSIEKIGEDFYIFYHRQTNGTEFSRQGCAERIVINEDGSIDQVEITSNGLNGEPLLGQGNYPAAIACHITDRSTLDSIDYQNPVLKTQTRITECPNYSYITGIQDSSKIGYKYFSCDKAMSILLEVRGDFEGNIRIATDERAGHVVGNKQVYIRSENWLNIIIPGNVVGEEISLYLIFTGCGNLELRTIGFVDGNFK